MAGYIQRLERRAANMGAMMDRLRLDPARVFTAGAGMLMAGAVRRCMACRNADECAAWLAHPDERPGAWRTFCPNAEVFARSRD